MSPSLTNGTGYWNKSSVSIFLKGCISWRLLFHKKKRKKKVGQLKHGKALSDEPLRASRGIESQIFVHLTITPLLSSLLRSSFRLLNKK